MSYGEYLCISVGYKPRSEKLGHRIHMCSALVDTAEVFSTVLISVYTLTSSIGVLVIYNLTNT